MTTTLTEPEIDALLSGEAVPPCDVWRLTRWIQFHDDGYEREMGRRATSKCTEPAAWACTIACCTVRPDALTCEDHYASAMQGGMVCTLCGQTQRVVSAMRL